MSKQLLANLARAVLDLPTDLDSIIGTNAQEWEERSHLIRRYERMATPEYVLELLEELGVVPDVVEQGVML